jgi:PAS domain S-box-containing protein
MIDHRLSISTQGSSNMELASHGAEALPSRAHGDSVMKSPVSHATPASEGTHPVRLLEPSANDNALDVIAGLGDVNAWLQILPRVVEHSDNMVVITDREQRIRWVNKTYSAVTGWSLKEVMGRRASEFLHGPLTSTRVTSRLKSDLSAGRAVSGVELVNYSRDGRAYTVLLNIEPIRDEHGQVAAYFSIQSDISEKRGLEQANARLQHHLQVAQKLAQLGRIEYDHQLGRSRWSSELYRIVDQPVSDEARDFEALMALCPPPAQSSIRQKLDLALLTGEEFDEEFPLTTPDGELRWVRCRGVPDFVGQGYRMPSTWMVQDVSVYYELIEERRRTNETLTRMVEERTRQLEDANRALTDFSHALSHDLKKPIRHMVSYAEILQYHLEEGALEQARDYGQRVRTAGARLHNLVEAMLKFSRLGRQGVDKTMVPMTLLLTSVIEDARNSWPDRQIVVTGLDDLPTVHADAVLIREVWVNLVDNAIKYSGHRPVVEIELGHSRDAGGQTVWIRDRGCGFDPGLLDHILQMFGRACDDATIPGDGIGLALAKQIVESHGGGRLWGESQPGSGATFCVCLPAVR